MTGVILFILLPLALLVVAWRIRPVVRQGDEAADPYGANLAVGGLFGGHGLEPDRRVVPEDDSSPPFDLDAVRPRECQRK